MIEKELSPISEVILYNLIITTGSFSLYTYIHTHIYNLVITTGSLLVNLSPLIYYAYLTPLYYLVITGWFLLVTLAIKNDNCIVTHGRAFNTGDDQFIHNGPLGSDNIRMNIVDPVDMNTLLQISRDEITIVHDAIGGFISWSKKLVTLNAWVRLLN